jgi:hypothetical protein
MRPLHSFEYRFERQDFTGLQGLTGPIVVMVAGGAR